MSDPCCWACKSGTGICLTRFQCDHHKQADAQDEQNHRARRTHTDRTAEQAIANIMQQQRGRKKPK